MFIIWLSILYPRFRSETSPIISSIIRLKRNGLKLSPCLTPVGVGTLLESSPSMRIFVEQFEFISLIVLTILGDIPFLRSILITSSRWKQSKALAKSMKQRQEILLYFRAFSLIWRRVNIASVVDLFLQKPCCSSLFSICCSNLSLKILVSSFRNELNSDIPL